MKKAIILLTLLLSLAEVTAENLIQNGSFIQKDANNMPLQWKPALSVRKKTVFVGLDNTNSKSGGQSLCIKNPDDKCYTRVEQLDVPCKPHTKYIASFWCKGENIATSQRGGARMFIGPDGKLNRPIASFGPGLELFKRTVPNPWTFGWTKYESPVFSSGKSKSLGVTLFLNKASGTVWFDNVEIREYGKDAKKSRETERARRLMQKDVQQIAKIAPQLEAQLKNISTKIDAFTPEKRNIRSGMPFYAPQKELGVLFSSYLRKKFPGRELIFTQATDPLKRQSAYLVPQGTLPKSITLCGLENETECFAVNVTNCSATEKTLRIEIPKHLEMTSYCVTHVETDRQESVDDALLPRKEITIPAGMTRQIYFSVKLNYAKQGTIRIGKQTLDIICRPKQTAMPEKQPITVFGYAYPYRFDFISKIEEARKLRIHLHHNGAMPYQYCSPMPYFDAAGKFIPGKMDWGKLDVILMMTAAPQRLIIPIPSRTAAHIRDFIGTDNGKPIALGSKEWERRISLWLKELVRGLKKRGISYDRFSVVLIDEPNVNEIPYMKKVAALVRKTDKKIRIYNNFHHGIPAENLADFLSIVDIAAPEIAEMSPAKMQILKKSGKELWCYHVQNRSYPAEKMRDLFVTLRKENFKGFSYWCFYDESPRWVPAGGQSYAVIYDDADGKWHPSKRAEAIREGVEVFTLLTLLQKQNPAEYKKLCSSAGSLSYAGLRARALQFIK